MLARNPWYLVIFVVILPVIGNNLIFLNSDLNTKIFFWAVVNLLIAIVVLIPSLSLIGEYYRYIEYGLVPVGIAVGITLNSLNSSIIVAVFVALFIGFFALIRLKKNVNDSKMLVNPNDIRLYQSLKDCCPGNFLVIPSIRTLEVNYFSQISVVHLVRGHGILGYLAQIIETYKIGYILKFKGSDPYDIFEGIKKSLSIEKTIDFENFEIYEIRQNSKP